MLRKNEANLVLEKHLAELRMPYEAEYRFYKPRKWRADYIIFVGPTDVMLEIEGGVFAMGRHVRGSGFLADMEKYNTATMLGYRVLRFSTQQILDGTAKRFLAEWLK